MNPGDRLARLFLDQGKFEALTVFAVDGDMVAFRYDRGGYGWATASTFVPLQEAERILNDIEERRANSEALKRVKLENRIRIRLNSTLEEAERLQEALDMLHEEER